MRTKLFYEFDFLKNNKEILIIHDLKCLFID